jgi:hypothetical protein
MDNDKILNLQYILEETPEKDWYKILAEFEGKQTEITLLDVIEVSNEGRVYYKDFINHLKSIKLT